MKLVTWNTQWCRGLDGIVDPRRIIDGARVLADFDVLCLQEIAQGYEAMPGAPGDQPAQLQALLPGFRVFFGPAVEEFDAMGRRQRFGNLVATRLPVRWVRHHLLPCPADASGPSMPRACTALTVEHPALGALRVMTTHMEYYATGQRLAQTAELRRLHIEACALAAAPPRADAEDAGTPFQPKAHTPHALLCGDFNFGPGAPEHALLQQSFERPTPDGGDHRRPDEAAATCRYLCDAWPLVHGSAPHAPTFRLFDRCHGPDPIACDFVFVSESLAPRVRRIEVDGGTRASDHQPVLVELD